VRKGVSSFRSPIWRKGAREAKSSAENTPVLLHGKKRGREGKDPIYSSLATQGEGKRSTGEFPNNSIQKKRRGRGTGQEEEKVLMTKGKQRTKKVSLSFGEGQARGGIRWSCKKSGKKREKRECRKG